MEQPKEVFALRCHSPGSKPLKSRQHAIEFRMPSDWLVGTLPMEKLSLVIWRFARGLKRNPTLTSPRNTVSLSATHSLPCDKTSHMLSIFSDQYCCFVSMRIQVCRCASFLSHTSDLETAGLRQLWRRPWLKIQSLSKIAPVHS